MVDDPDGGLGSSRPLSVRSIAIFAMSSMVAVCAGGGSQLAVGRVLEGAGGPTLPELAGLASAGPVFYLCAELLRRHIR
jgi:hypothetical protein